MMKLNQNGFTLVETLVAIFVFTISLAGLLGILSRGIFATREAANTSTASFLAQEGIELIEAIRYGNFLESVQPTLGILPVCLNSCYVDPGVPLVATPCGPTCPLIEIDNNGQYGYGLSDSIESQFRRIISVAPVDSSNRNFTITSTVEWSSGKITRNVTYTKEGKLWLNPLDPQ